MKAITPVVAVILLIVMTVGIAAFTFVWMQNFMQSLTTKSEQTIKQLERPQFQIVDGYYDNGNFKIFVYNSGTVPVNFTKAKLTIKVYSKIDGSYQGYISGNLNCADSLLQPNQQTSCTITPSGNIDINSNSYEINIFYRGFTATYIIE